MKSSSVVSGYHGSNNREGIMDQTGSWTKPIKEDRESADEFVYPGPLLILIVFNIVIFGLALTII